jgi:hypothetical protein
MRVPNHRERQLLQYLRGRGWVNEALLPPARKTLDTLLRNEWIERAGDGPTVAYRITEQGMAERRHLAGERWEDQTSDQ